MLIFNEFSKNTLNDTAFVFFASVVNMIKTCEGKTMKYNVLITYFSRENTIVSQMMHGACDNCIRYINFHIDWLGAFETVGYLFYHFWWNDFMYTCTVLLLITWTLWHWIFHGDTPSFVYSLMAKWPGWSTYLGG